MTLPPPPPLAVAPLPRAAAAALAAWALHSASVPLPPRLLAPPDADDAFAALIAAAATAALSASPRHAGRDAVTTTVSALVAARPRKPADARCLAAFAVWRNAFVAFLSAAADAAVEDASHAGPAARAAAHAARATLRGALRRLAFDPTKPGDFEAGEYADAARAVGAAVAVLAGATASLRAWRPLPALVGAPAAAVVLAHAGEDVEAATAAVARLVRRQDMQAVAAAAQFSAAARAADAAALADAAASLAALPDTALARCARVGAAAWARGAVGGADAAGVATQLRTLAALDGGEVPTGRPPKIVMGLPASRVRSV